MKVQFLQDFQGVETGNVFYSKGQVVNLPDGVGAKLVEEKRVLLVEDTRGAKPARQFIEDVQDEQAEPVFKRKGRKG
jgi:hypothetical protein